MPCHGRATRCVERPFLTGESSDLSKPHHPKRHRLAQSGQAVAHITVSQSVAESDQIPENGAIPMNTQPTADQNIGYKTPSNLPPTDREKPQPIRFWQERFERYLESIGRKETRKRYARALERFLGKHPDRVYGHQFLRPVINDYVQSRLTEGASVSTVRLEMSAIRGLFQFAMDMGAFDLMFNPAKNVKVRQPKRGSSKAVAQGQNEANEFPASVSLESTTNKTVVTS